ncbi:MAG TPA: flagellar hook-length control protein FliK [Sphingomonas sp.]|nr:flagellar hook-length control protein FliK [Sphingomonas sp.]
MLELSPSILLPSLKTPGTGANPAPAGDFSVALAGLLAVDTGATAADATPALAKAVRQEPAASGNPLPGQPIEDVAVDPALAWLDGAGAAPKALAPQKKAAPIQAESNHPSDLILLPESVPVAVRASRRAELQVGDVAAPAASPLAIAIASAAATVPVTSAEPAVAPSRPVGRKKDESTSGKAEPDIQGAPAAQQPVPQSVIPFAPALPIATADPMAASPAAGTVRPTTSALSLIRGSKGRAGQADGRLVDGGRSAVTGAAAAEAEEMCALPVRSSAAPELSDALPDSPNTAESRSQPISAQAGTVAVEASVMPNRQVPMASVTVALPTSESAPDSRTDRRAVTVAQPSAGPMGVQVQSAPAMPAAPAPYPLQPGSPNRDISKPEPEPAVQRADSPPVARADMAQPAARPATAVPPQPMPVAVQPAGMVFGFALATALDQRQRADSRDQGAPRAEALQALTAAAGSAQAVAAVGSSGDARHAALDMRRDDWPQAMIDRIDALRDAADATSTRIRLIPDALGKVDVSLRHDGDALHVHFAADVATTRALIADAQPRLAEAAQARGLRLGQATVDAGGGHAGHQPHRQPATPTPFTARPVAAAAVDDGAIAESSRLA